MSRPPRRQTEPLETNERIPVGIGIACWAVALVVLLILRGHLPGVREWWIWTCVAGIGGGLFGFFYIPHLRRKRRV